jgi:CDP-2,3-bis-(O-geranylgeranyl)-sn-glycerol synthase
VLMILFDPLWILSNVTLPVLIAILILTPILHRLVNKLGYIMGIKEVHGESDRRTAKKVQGN